MPQIYAKNINFVFTPSHLIKPRICQEYLIEEKYMQIHFCEKKPGSEIYRYTAVLLNKPHSISYDNGMLAMSDVATWYKKHDHEFAMLNSLKWVDCPEWLEIN
jgi:hypothetical protein